MPFLFLSFPSARTLFRTAVTITLLCVSTRLNFHLLRAHAIQSIEDSPTTLDPIDNLVLAINYKIPEWLTPAYIALCQRPNCLEEWEAEKIGLKKTADRTDTRGLPGREPPLTHIQPHVRGAPRAAEPRAQRASLTRSFWNGSQFNFEGSISRPRLPDGQPGQRNVLLLDSPHCGHV
ncbi:hypothetical protein B0H14DRAFT_2680170 [Mycena olivaceomarginata]|nr:hypothetical protein B0H14DRAFT_2680170 [Mycena olivaceomarginata]